MLSDEEKAIEELKNKKADYFMISNLTGKTLLNLIEKQSKEIESLKEDNKKKSIVIIEYQDLYEKLEDKIKAKIEEVEQWELYNMKIPKLSTLDERLGAKVGIKYVLQSLLEKE